MEFLNNEESFNILPGLFTIGLSMDTRRIKIIGMHKRIEILTTKI